MHSHLIVVTFEGQDEASNVYDALERMRASPLLGLQNAAIVGRDGSGQLSVTQKRPLSQIGKDTGANLASLALVLVFGDPPAETLQALEKAGLDGLFREQVVKAIGPDSSAILIVVPPSADVDRNRLLGILRLFKGKVYETTLPREAEAALAKGWEA